MLFEEVKLIGGRITIEGEVVTNLDLGGSASGSEVEEAKFTQAIVVLEVETLIGEAVEGSGVLGEGFGKSGLGGEANVFGVWGEIKTEIGNVVATVETRRGGVFQG